MDRRAGERRRGPHFTEREMRCLDCGTVWYSAVAEVVAPWARCAHCQGPLHIERRTSTDRRD